jgi:hypothetical protein
MGRQLGEVGQAYADELEAVEAALMEVGGWLVSVGVGSFCIG